MTVGSIVSSLTGTSKLLGDTLKLPKYSSILTTAPLPYTIPLGLAICGLIAYFVLAKLGQPSKKDIEKTKMDAIHDKQVQTEKVKEILDKEKKPYMSVIQNLTSYITGTLFGTALGVAGMTRADKIVRFLDLFSPESSWAPDMAFVMGGAFSVAAVGYYYYKKNGEKSLFEERNFVPSISMIPKKLIFGAALFGIGWGLTGYCPGPALVSFFANPFDLPRAAYLLVMTGSMVLGKLF